MESLAGKVKTEVGKYKNIIQTLTGLISILTGIIAFVTSLFQSKYNLALICIGLFLINLGVCRKLLSAKRESFGVLVNTLTSKQIKIVKRIIIGSYLLWLFPLYLAVNYFTTKNSNCGVAQNTLGLIITSFTNDNDDDFSYKLFKILDTELENTDTINTIRTEKFINAGRKNYQDSISQLFNNNCYRRGLLVFGKRSEQSKLFDCSIYINDVLNLYESIGVQNKKIINLQNPDLINFSIEDQAQTVSEFILGLLYFNSNNFSLSKKKFQHCSELILNDDNRKLKSHCALFVGNNLFKEMQYANAIKQYQIGINYDSNNAYLHYNLATALLKIGDSLNAYAQYELSSELNNKFSNPLGEANMKAAIIKPMDDKAGNRKGDVVVHNLKSPQASVQVKRNLSDSIDSKKEYEKSMCGNKYGIVYGEKTIVDCIYDYVDETFYGYKDQFYFIVGNNHLYGAFNRFGKMEVPIKYSSVEEVKTMIQKK